LFWRFSESLPGLDPGPRALHPLVTTKNKMLKTLLSMLALLVLVPFVQSRDFIVVFKPTSSKLVESAKSEIKKFGGKVKHELKLINALAVSMPHGLDIDASRAWLDTLPGVDYIEEDGEVGITSSE